MPTLPGLRPTQHKHHAEIHAHCIDGRADAANQRITDALCDTDGPEAGDDAQGEASGLLGYSFAFNRIT
jgi:hypothetical protein